MEAKFIMAYLFILLVVLVTATDRSLNRTDLNCTGTAYHNVSLSAYYPKTESENEADYLDARQKKIRTLQDFLDGRADFVTASMDMSGIAYGTKICIHELNHQYRRQVPLQVRDSSPSSNQSRHPDFSHVEIAVRTEEDTYDKSVNKDVTLYV
ncbi:hypothetical protein KM043_016381 [Ampulex compressa]|nr:hypothetical protein KM043_016381 [Ampulex compressa]